MQTSTAEKRRKPRNMNSGMRVVRIGCKDGLGHTRWITADVVDSSPAGAGLSLSRPLEVGQPIEFRPSGDQSPARGRVVWCRDNKDGTYSAGVEFAPEGAPGKSGPAAGPAEENDFYEIMQLSPNADLETIHRVYRILAQRYHPDNRTSGNQPAFLRLSEAYAVLSDPALRAAYDARHREMRQVRRKILTEMEAAGGAAAEKQKRKAVLELLYAKTLHDFEHPTLTIHEIENLLGCPREHLQAALWFLKGKGYVQRSDNGRYALTVEGFEQAELAGTPPPEAALRGRLLAGPGEPASP